MALNRDQVLASSKKKLPRAKVPTPEWAPEGANADDAYVFVKTMRGTESDRWEQTLSGRGKQKVNLDNIRAKMAVAVCEGDEEGVPLFTEQDIAALGEMSCVPLRRIFDEACKLNGIGKEHVDELVGES